MKFYVSNVLSFTHGKTERGGRAECGLSNSLNANLRTRRMWLQFVFLRLTMVRGFVGQLRVAWILLACKAGGASFEKVKFLVIWNLLFREISWGTKIFNYSIQPFVARQKSFFKSLISQNNRKNLAKKLSSIKLLSKMTFRFLETSSGKSKRLKSSHDLAMMTSLLIPPSNII